MNTNILWLLPSSTQDWIYVGCGFLILAIAIFLAESKNSPLNNKKK